MTRRSKGFLAHLRLRRELAAARREVEHLRACNAVQRDTIVRLLEERRVLRHLVIDEVSS